MAGIFNIYCDESSHLPNDGDTHMVLGAISCPLEKTVEVATRLKEIREKHSLPSAFEIKWTKVSRAKLDYYLDLIDYFFDDDDLCFRAVIADKSTLNHTQYSQTHDVWYFKMMYLLVTRLLTPTASHRIYLDKKDTRSGEKVRKLHEILSKSQGDFDQKIIERVQIVQSHDVIQLQLADLLIGAVSYANKGLRSSAAKIEIVNRIRQRSKYELTRSTLLREEKFNLFHWSGK